MKGCKFFYDIESIKVKKDLMAYRPKTKIKNKKAYFRMLKEKGYFNGDILGCTDYFLANNKILLKCQKVRFFDFLSYRKHENLPKLVNANAIIESNRKIILIKRNNKVFSYRNYWDYPAGLVFFDEKPIIKLMDRIRIDTGLTIKQLSEGKILAIGIAKRYLAVFYIFKVKLSNEKILKLVNKSKNFKLVQLKISAVRNFLKTHKVVFPEIFFYLANRENI